jgi:hypothetical protein
MTIALLAMACAPFMAVKPQGACFVGHPEDVTAGHVMVNNGLSLTAKAGSSQPGYSSNVNGLSRWLGGGSSATAAKACADGGRLLLSWSWAPSLLARLPHNPAQGTEILLGRAFSGRRAWARLSDSKAEKASFWPRETPALGLKPSRRVTAGEGSEPAKSFEHVKWPRPTG